MVEEESNQYLSDINLNCIRCKINTIIGGKIYNCENCNDQPLKIYCEKCYKENKFCDFCKNEINLNKGIYQLDLKVTTECPLNCGKIINVNDLKEHLKTCINKKNAFECKLCDDEICADKKTFFQHIIDKHKEQVYEMFSE